MKQPAIKNRPKAYPLNDSKDFAFYSANLGHFIPTIPYEDHGKLFEESCAHQRRSLEEQKFEPPASTIKLLDFEESAFDKPSIIATFHTGSYRLLSRCLANKGISHALVLTRDVLQAQGKTFIEIIKNIAPNLYFELIDAEESHALLKMRQVLRKGHHLLVYVDGNSGAGKNTKDTRQSICLDFLNGKLWVRAGVAYLSFLMKSPILPIVSTSVSWNREELCMKPAIIPSVLDTQEAYINTSMRTLYRHLERFLIGDVAQWENWFFLHQDMEIECHNVNDKLLFSEYDPVIWAPYRMQDSFFVLHKPTYQSYRLTREHFYLTLNSAANR